MENPLNKEQIKKFNEISKLTGEKQQQELQKFIKTLTPEQVEFLKKQQMQGGECPFCSITEGKISSYKIYEDNELVAVLDIKPANEGHVLIIPKKHVQFSTDLEDVGHIFNIANKIAKRIYDVLKLDSNIFLANGVNAGQRMGHMIVHVIPRKENDKIVFNWNGKELDEKTLEELKNELYFVIEEPKIIEEIDDNYEEEPRLP